MRVIGVSILLFLPVLLHLAHGFGSGEKVLLRDVQVLTLYAGKQAAARRGSSIPQLECVGGTANGKFYPRVVQCYNRGSDGSDVQWECKTDMDNDYRFGSIDVSCEGYDYPDDPYILKGSCGLRYTIDYTKQGHSKEQESHNYGQGYADPGKTYSTTGTKGFKMGDVVFFVIVGIFIFIVYKICLGNQTPYGADTGRYEDDPPPPYPGNDHSGPRYRGGQPPPPGFRPEFHDDNNGGCGAGTSFGTRTNTRNRQDGPGFWTGMAGGGVLGYLFGRGNTGHYNQGYGGYNRGYGGNYYGGGGGSSWFGGGGGYTTRTSTSPSSSTTGTRTASGFGGTSRR